MFILYLPFNHNLKLIHAWYFKESLSLSPWNKKNKKALEFCQHLVFPCPQNVRTWSLRDTQYCFYEFCLKNLWDTSNINLGALKKKWIRKTVILTPQRQVTVMTQKIVDRILTLFLDFRVFLASLINRRGWEDQRKQQELLQRRELLM